jgi:dihydrofolate reductase
VLYHIVAMAENRVIGANGRLPWHFSSDLKFFKQTTMGNTIIMGRKTFDSIGKPLPGRENFVLSRSPQKIEGVTSFASINEALGTVKTEKAFIIGGAEIFKQTMSQIDGIYLTQIHGKFEGDVYYPEIPKEFKEKSRATLQENPKIEVIFYEKK